MRYIILWYFHAVSKFWIIILEKIYLRSIEMEFEDVTLVFLTIAVWNLALKEYDKDSLMCLAYMMSITKVSQLLKIICFCVDL